MKRLLKAFLYSVILALLSLFSVTLFWKTPFTLTMVMIALSAAMLLIWRSKEDLYLFIIVGISGALAESFAIAFGAWSYGFSDLNYIPTWLPFLWGIVGIFIKRISMEIHEFLKSKRQTEAVRRSASR